MRKIVLISCVKKKQPHRAKAKDLYVSPLFKLSLKYAKSLNPDGIFILSAKYGLVDLEKELEPYDETLNTMSVKEVKAWARSVIEQLRKEIDMRNDRVIFLAGERYTKYLVSRIDNCQILLEGLPIGKRLQYLKSKVLDEQ